VVGNITGAARVFAVEDDRVQVCWRGLPAGTVLSAGDASFLVETEREPGAVALGGLTPATVYDLVVTEPGRRAPKAEPFATLMPPPGELLARFATVNDVHIGERHFGLLGTIKDPVAPDLDPYAIRCLRAALSEAVAWGAEAILAKGDLTWSGRPGQWTDVADVLGSTPVPVAAVLGNHDVFRRSADGVGILAAHGVLVGDAPLHLDLPGIRLVLAHSARPGHSGGEIDAEQRGQLADLVAGAGTPAFVGMHHHLQRFQQPTGYPPGIPGYQADAVLDALAAANPATFVSVGHSHRHRLRRRGPLVITQIGATMHYPGTWAGYAVHEGGIRQVVYRIAEPSAIAWTEHTRQAVLGAWAPWAAGLCAHRCLTHPWPTVSST